MEYTAALEEKSNAQSKRIIDLDAIVYGQTVLTNTTDYAARAVSTGDNKELTEIRSMMKPLAALVTAQAATVATLFTKINGSSSGARQNTDKKKANPGFHVCTHCKQEVYHRDGNFLDLEANNVKYYPGWNSILNKE